MVFGNGSAFARVVQLRGYVYRNISLKKYCIYRNMAFVSIVFAKLFVCKDVLFARVSHLQEHSICRSIAFVKLLQLQKNTQFTKVLIDKNKKKIASGEMLCWQKSFKKIAFGKILYLPTFVIVLHFQGTQLAKILHLQDIGSFLFFL